MEHSKGKVVIEYHPGEDSHRIAPRNSNVNGGYIIAGCHGKADKANCKRIAALWNAADGMTTEEAIQALAMGKLVKKLGLGHRETSRYIQHGREMVRVARWLVNECNPNLGDCGLCRGCDLIGTLDKEGA